MKEIKVKVEAEVTITAPDDYEYQGITIYLEEDAASLWPKHNQEASITDLYIGKEEITLEKLFD